jgi:glyoxylase-like metal-dependent hydrolase (beta-lactamase superfamily II)
MSSFVSRRQLLKVGAIGMGGMLVPGYGLLHARGSAASHSFKVGDIEITVLSDGRMSLPQSFLLPDIDPEKIDALFAEAAAGAPTFDLEVNAAIIKTGDRVVLVDTGGGTDFMPGMGKLPDLLSELSIDPETITDVIFTHAHPDHFWGVIDPFDEASRFTQARHFMASAEIDFWLAEDLEKKVSVQLQGVSIGTQRRLKSIKDQLTSCAPGDEIVPGVHAVDTAGHTAGHLSLHLTSKGEELFIGGDVLSHPIVSFAQPEWRWGGDMDVEKAANVRVRTLDKLATDRIPLLGYHLPWPGLGRVERKGTGYRFASN